MTPKICVVVSGGIVQEVVALNEEGRAIEVTVLDFDSDAKEPCSESEYAPNLELSTISQLKTAYE